MLARAIVIFVAILIGAGCASHVVMSPESAAPTCHTSTPAGAPAVRWMSPLDADDRKALRAWCHAVGPIARYDPEPADTPAPSSMLVVSWNMAVGEGRLPDLIDSVRRRETSGDSAVVLLIQEAYRRGDVPASCPATNGVGGRLGSTRDDNRDIIALARALRLHAVYVPSMRNSRNCVEPPAEDRGNAILSTLPIDDVLAIELPFAQQRRVGIAASVGGIRFVTAHFDTWRGHKDQARALVDVVESQGWEDVFIGGDFNVHPFDPGVPELRRVFDEVECGGATHVNGLRLDRIFVRGVDATCSRGENRYGSDHHPLILRVGQEDKPWRER